MNKNNQKIKIFVGVSGGVDSSVALALLKEQGYDVVGVFLKVWSPDFLPCNWREERRSAMRVCAKLGVPFKTLDCESEYKEKIVDYMISEYNSGRTPNPDVFCNKYIKFGVFLDKALEQGADFVATGHYSRKWKVESIKYKPEDKTKEKEISPGKLLGEECKEEYKLLEATDKEKDQSYFLSSINQNQLSKILLPIGHLKKSEVRELARKFDLETSEKKDSQGLCFIGKVDMKDFLKRFIKEKKGNVLDTNGNVLGEHDGSIFYTIGERISVFSKNTTTKTERLFVISKDIEKNTITVSSKIKLDKNEGQNFSTKTEVSVSDFNIISGEGIDLTKTYDVCFRYHQTKQKCTLKKTDYSDNRYKIIPWNKNSFDSDIASGQIAVLYQGEVCIASGIIE